MKPRPNLRTRLLETPAQREARQTLELMAEADMYAGMKTAHRQMPSKVTAEQVQTQRQQLLQAVNRIVRQTGR